MHNVEVFFVECSNLNKFNLKNQQNQQNSTDSLCNLFRLFRFKMRVMTVTYFSKPTKFYDEIQLKHIKRYLLQKISQIWYIIRICSNDVISQ